MATRAGVSEGAFNDIFKSFEDCFLAAFDEGLERLAETVREAARREPVWLGRVRSGVVALLGFLDDEPQWGRLLLLETSVAGAAALRCEQRTLGVLTQLLDDGPAHAGGALAGGEVAMSPQMTAELVAGGAFALLRARMGEQAGGGEGGGARDHERRNSLVELAPSLMSFIVRPYLGEAVARAELTGVLAPVEAASLQGAALPIRATHRTTLVLRAIAAAPGSTNRQVADAAGLADEGQTSRLLARLNGHGLIENVGVGAARGEPNAWLLTSCGERALETLGETFAARAPRRISRRIRDAA